MDDIHNASLGRATVLVVDDVPENLTILGGLLQQDYHVRVANCGARALGAARTAPHPDLILLDVMMPDMDGFEVLAQLKADPQTRSVPVIFVTALDGHGDEERGFAGGAVDYITKPLNPAVVRARVRTHLELKQTRDSLLNSNASLESQLVCRMRETLTVQDASMRMLASLVETRDNETGHHIRRTQAFVEVLAHSVRDAGHHRDSLADPWLGLMVKAAPLHDIGKVGIPDQILLKPGRLTVAEFEIMKTHSRIGSDAIDSAIREVQDESRFPSGRPRASTQCTVEPLRFLQFARDMVRSHHERWDGTGYPDGLAGEAIPLAARLMALADVYDALTSARPYKTAMPLAQADAIIREGRGTHFDPLVVEAFERVRGSFEAIARRYADPA